MSKYHLITTNIKKYQELSPDYIKILVTKMPPISILENTVVQKNLMAPNKILFKNSENKSYDLLKEEYEDYLLNNCMETINLIADALSYNDVYIIDFFEYDESLRKVIASVIEDMGYLTKEL